MKLWGGRFASDQRDPRFERFAESFSVDQRFILYDLRVNQAYLAELGKAGALSNHEVRRLSAGLEAIRRYVASHPRWARGQASEDVHTWVEARLEKEIGPVARKLRTGRSRNDLVATEERLFVKDAITELERSVLRLFEALVAVGRRHARAVMPGFTHFQPAQPVLFAHYLLAYFEMSLRDWARLEDCRKRADELPMGAGALAGTSFPIDRGRLARALGFARVCQNSLDATSDRDFFAELLFACALALTHLSRLAEDLIIFSSSRFGFVELADAYSTGSSLMPQKKNPDALELARGKSARVLGRLAGVLALLKGLPLAYNRDLQEDKPAVFEGVETTREVTEIVARVVATLRVREDKMRSATEEGYLTATDLAEELVRRGTPFAEAHEQVGRLARFASERGKTFGVISPEEARRLVPAWDARLQSLAASPWESVRRKKVVGGTAPGQVSRQLQRAERTISILKRIISRR